MSRTRSPEYPAISLKDAIERVRRIYEKAYQSELRKEALAGLLGYKGLSGASLPVLSALTKYGLLEGRGDKTRVSDRGLAIIAHEPGSPERIEALKAAAREPTIFATIDEKFVNGGVNDAAIRSFLLTQKFIPEAADTAIRAYRETKQLVANESGDYTGSMIPKEPSMPPDGQAAPRVPYQTTFTPASGAGPFRVTFTGSGIEISGLITDEGSADDLVRAVNALKLLLKPVGEPMTDRQAFDPARPFRVWYSQGIGVAPGQRAARLECQSYATLDEALKAQIPAGYSKLRVTEGPDDHITDYTQLT